MKKNYASLLRSALLTCTLGLSFGDKEAHAQTYCTPTYTFGCTQGDRIVALSLYGDNGTILSDPAGNCSGGNSYVNQTALNVSAHAGGTYTITLNTNATSGYDNVKVWVDFNNNKTFEEPSELVGSSTQVKNTPSTVSVTLPLNALQGNYRMRVRLNVDPSLSSLTPCGSTSLGEARDYTLILTAEPLPLNLLSFDGKANNNNNDLFWKVSESSNSTSYTLERSADGASFENIGQVNAGSSEKNFSFTDDHPMAGNNFYRIGISDVAGRTTFSNVIKIFREHSGDQMVIYPNPAKSFFHLKYTAANAETASISVLDLNGRVLWKEAQNLVAGNNDVLVNLPVLPGGCYNVQVQTATSLQLVKLFIN